MTRESRSKADLRILWMGIDDEVLVRRHRVHARGGVRNLSIQRRNSRPDRGPNCHLITRTDDPVDCGWSAFLTLQNECLLLDHQLPWFAVVRRTRGLAQAPK